MVRFAKPGPGWTLLLSSLLLVLLPTIALAQDCPTGTFACGDGSGCCPDGTSCGSGDDDCPADSCCAEEDRSIDPSDCPGGTFPCTDGSGCCPDGTSCGDGANGCPADSCCAATEEEPGQDEPSVCPTGAFECPDGDGCCPGGTSCGTGDNGCPADSCCRGVAMQPAQSNDCPADTFACSDGGCCPDASICGTGSNACPADSCCVVEDPGACPDDTFVCANGGCCPQGTVCGTDDNGCPTDSCCAPDDSSDDASDDARDETADASNDTGRAIETSSGNCPQGTLVCGGDGACCDPKFTCGTGENDCPEGSCCAKDGTLSCDSGLKPCADGCIPDDGICCGSYGWCEAGLICGQTGCDDLDSESTSGQSGADQYECDAIDDDQCDVQFCSNEASDEAYYEVDGKRFDCDSATDIDDCAEAAADHCDSSTSSDPGERFSENRKRTDNSTGNAKDDESGGNKGCAMAASSAPPAWPIEALGCALALFLVGRRRRR